MAISVPDALLCVTFWVLLGFLWGTGKVADKIIIFWKFKNPGDSQTVSSPHFDPYAHSNTPFLFIL